MSEPALQRMTAAEYLRTEVDSPLKREYVDGFAYPLRGQAGASKAHVRILGNIMATLLEPARQAGVRLYFSDLRLHLPHAIFYPDLMAACGPDNPDDDFETGPCLLIEVLSPSTAAHDRVGKFQAYTALPSLQTYLLMEQAERRIYAWQRRGVEWDLQELAGDGLTGLPCLDHSLSLDAIYQGVRP